MTHPMRSARFLSLGMLLLVQPALCSSGPDTLVLRSGLLCAMPPRFAETVIAPNPIEAALATGVWKTPQAGQRVEFSPSFATEWTQVVADSDGWFEGDAFAGCYVAFTVESPTRRIMLLRGMGNEFAYVNGTLRSGNPYGLNKTYAPWEPHFDYSLLPVLLEAGRNEILVRCARGRLSVSLLSTPGPLLLNDRDLTMPDLVRSQPAATWGAIVVVNASEGAVKDAVLVVRVEGCTPDTVRIPLLLPLGVRKVGFPIRTPDAGLSDTLRLIVALARERDSQPVDRRTIPVRVVGERDNRKETFISGIDGSVQYYGFLAATDPSPGPKALVLSLHGAAVEAINQTGSYAPKTWAHIVAPTNRRPYGFNWEEWGRLDAMEVLDLVKRRTQADENRIYLTGHSMGGHGTWHVGAMYPDQFAAIGPSAGWISFWTYRIKGQVDTSALRSVIRRTTTPSETFDFIDNYKSLGVYILHGSDDDNVPPTESRAMVERLAKGHRDFVYHEEQGAGHWWDRSDEPGADCVDWAPLFDFFARHARPGKLRVREVDFSTANPAVSARNQWLTISAQQKQLALSRARLRVDPAQRRFVGTTENIARIALDTDVLGGSGPVSIDIDGQTMSVPGASAAQVWLERRSGSWTVAGEPARAMKGPHRYGTLKEVFVRRVVFVYGTRGTREENRWALEKARFDAERFWYQGNGTVDVLPDSEFDPKAEPDRSVMLYGNARTNSAWMSLLGESPVQVNPGEVRVEQTVRRGNDLTCFLVRPRPGSERALVGVIAGTGIVGMKAANRVPYMSPGINLPDCTVMTAEVLTVGEPGVLLAGFFGLDWTYRTGEFAGPMSRR